MATYPTTLDTFINPISSDDLDSGTVPHAEQHAHANDSIKAIQAELGLLPKGAAVSVRARLDVLDTTFAGKVSTTQLAVASGVATLDGSSKLVQFLDAAKVNSGTLALARLPLITPAKMDLTAGALALSLIPPIPASQTTSGTFALARIPGLPGNWITSGTIDAARLPSTVTSNANAKVVADLAARDAILLADRVDGMLVWGTSEKLMWKYRAAGNTWDIVGTMNSINVSEPTDLLGITSTVFTPGSPLCGTVFIAPPNGKIKCTTTGHLEGNVAGAQPYLAPEIRNGGSLGAGVVFEGAITEKAVSIGPGVMRMRASTVCTFTGLTPGNTYNIYTMHLTLAGNIDVFYRELLIEGLA